MNTSGSSAIAIHMPSACLKRARQLVERRRLVRLEHAFVDAGGERLDRTAEQHVDLRIVLLGDDARQRLARREADEVDLDAGRLLELLEHRPRPVLRPDRIGVHRLGSAGRCQPGQPDGQRKQRKMQPFHRFPQYDSFVTWGNIGPFAGAEHAISEWLTRVPNGLSTALISVTKASSTCSLQPVTQPSKGRVAE